MLLTCLYLNFKMEYFNNYVHVYVYLKYPWFTIFFSSWVTSVSFRLRWKSFFGSWSTHYWNQKIPLRFCQEATLQPKVLVLGSDLPTTLAFCDITCFSQLAQLAEASCTCTCTVPVPCPPPLSSGTSPYKSRLPSAGQIQDPLDCLTMNCSRWLRAANT